MIGRQGGKCFGRDGQFLGNQPVPEYNCLVPEYNCPAPEYNRPAPEYNRPAPEYSRPGPEYNHPPEKISGIHSTPQIEIESSPN